MEQNAVSPKFPRVWWHNGMYEEGTNGYFYTTAREFEGYTETPLDNWEHIQLNDREAGFKTSELRLAVIRRRSQGFVDEINNGVRTRIWIDRGERVPRTRYYTELLCMVHGYSGLITLNMKGLTGSIFTNRKDGLLIKHSMNVRSLDNTRVPSWAYWMHIRSPVDENGNILYTLTQNGIYATPPQLLPIGTATADELKDLWVGAERLKQGEEVYEATRAWQGYTRTNREDGEVW